MKNVDVALARMLALDRRLRGEDGVGICALKNIPLHAKVKGFENFSILFSNVSIHLSIHPFFNRFQQYDIHFLLLGEGVHRNLGIIESLGLPCFAGFDARFKALEKAWLPFMSM